VWVLEKWDLKRKEEKKNRHNNPQVKKKFWLHKSN
jgi:hypothetical protein